MNSHPDHHSQVGAAIPAMRTSDGAGVRIHRAIGTSALRHLDPFLMLDHFDSDNSSDYIAGFPDHPHRGMSTFTYMIDGRMEHADSLGNRGIIEPGGVQWMKAAHGIIHSEMPRQIEGRMRGFQLWINLPANDKLSAPFYQEHDSSALPVLGTADWSATVLVGSLQQAQSPVQDACTDSSVIDLRMQGQHQLKLPWRSDQQGFAFCYEGSAMVNGTTLPTRHLLRLDRIQELTISSPHATRILLASGTALHEPIVQSGPFVMNSQEQILQAIEDYRNGSLTQLN